MIIHIILFVISSKLQLSIVFRYVLNGEIMERFFEFVDVSEDHCAVALYKIVISLIYKLKCENKFVEQGYDGAAVMSGEKGGVQTVVREKFANAKYIHCNAHVLNLVLSKSMNCIKPVKIFFKTLSAVSTFFSHSSKRINALDKTRWNFTSRLVNTVEQHLEDLIILFENIIDSPDDWDEATTLSARCFVSFFNTFETKFILRSISNVFKFTDYLFNVMQSHCFNISFCIKAVEQTRSNILSLRDNYINIFNGVVAENGTPAEKRNVDNSLISNKYILKSLTL